MSKPVLKRAPIAPTQAADLTVAGKTVKRVPLRGTVKNLVILKVSDEIDETHRVRAQIQVQAALGAENLVLVLPDGVEVEVIPLVDQETLEERKNKAPWAF